MNRKTHEREPGCFLNTNDSMSDLINIATEYVSRGWKVIPIPLGQKGPKLTGWQNLRINVEQIPFAFDKPSNIGVLCGEPSKLVCVDIDNPIAKQLAGVFLPHTDLKTGRPSAPESHWFYSVQDPPAAKKFAIPKEAKTDTHHSVEILSTGNQVVVGPSVHPSGEIYDSLNAIPAEISGDELKAACLALHRAVLAKLGVSEDPPKAKKPSETYQPANTSDLLAALNQHGAQVIGEGTTNNGHPGYYLRCPNADLHTTSTGQKDTMAWTGPQGGFQAKCFHASCGIDSWESLRTALNPTWQSQSERLESVDLSGLTNPPTDDEIDIEEEIGTAEIGFPEECLTPPGILGEIVRYNLETAKYPQPEHALAGALALMSAVTGRRVRDQANTRTNLMIVALGPTRSGKEHPRQINKNILEICGLSQMYEEKLASHSSLHGFLSKSPAGLLMNDEFGDFLALARSTKGANTQPAQIISAMIKLYSSAGGQYKADRYADNAKQVTIDQPHLVLYGTSTGEVFWKHVTPEYLSGGLFGRVMIFENRGYVDPRPILGTKVPMPESIIREINGWISCYSHYDQVFWEHPDPIIVPHTPEARVRYESHELAISQKRKPENPIRAALWSGTAEITGKLALLFACSRSRNPLQIQIEDVDLAIRLSNWLTRRKVELSQENVAENQVESASKRVYRLIKSAGAKGVSKFQLSRMTQWLRAKERQEILSDMIQNGLIASIEISTHRRPKTVFMVRQYAAKLEIPGL